MGTNSAVCLFARAPSAPGKKRLTEQLSADRAHALRHALLWDTLACAREAGFPIVVCYTPAAARAEVETLIDDLSYRGPRPHLIRQSDGDLGVRMRCAFDDVFALGHERVVLIGSDLPTLPPEHITAAMTALERVPVVLGPANDGGYYLIGLRQPRPDLFSGVAWGGGDVLTQTMTRAAQAGVVVELVPHWHDVDTPDDLENVSSSPRALHTRAWFEKR